MVLLLSLVLGYLALGFVTVGVCLEFDNDIPGWFVIAWPLIWLMAFGGWLGSFFK